MVHRMTQTSLAMAQDRLHKKILEDYACAIAHLEAEEEREGRLSKEEFYAVLKVSFETLGEQIPVDEGTNRKFHLIYRVLVRCLIMLVKLLLIVTVLYALVACHSPTQKMLSRHIQGYIYPVMRGVRIGTLPLLRAYPSLTDWHEEPCVIRNPFYGLQGPDCWPCESVRSILALSALTNFSESYYHNGVPFVVNDAMKGEIGWRDLQNLFEENSEVLERSAPRISATNLHSVTLLHDLLLMPERNVSEQHQQAHVTWKITRSDAARVLRQLFPRPYFVPLHTEVAIQRFMFIDSPMAPPHQFPLSDFANVWVAQGSGSRLVALKPSPQCLTRCLPVSVLLQPNQVLFYNWQFWRPRSLPVQGSKGLSISFMGSFY